MSNKKKIFIILGVCHGLTEEVFIEEVGKRYKTLYLNEKGINNDENIVEEPKIMFFSNKNKIQSTEVRKRLIKNFNEPLFIGSIVQNAADFKDYEIHFMVMLDFKENGHNPIQEAELLRTNCKDEIISALTEVDIIPYNEFGEKFDHTDLYKGSTLIFFNYSIESNFKDFPNYDSKRRKTHKMRKWIRSQNFNSTDEIKNFFREQIINPEGTNLMKLFDSFDEILDDFITKL